MRRDPVRLPQEAEEPHAWTLLAGLAWVSGATLALTAAGHLPQLGYAVSIVAAVGAIWVGRWPR